MNDESKHYGYFYNLLVYTWENLREEHKKSIGQNFALFIKSYLNITSEKEFNTQLLNNLFHDPNKSKAIISELYNGFDITPEISIVKNVMNVLKKTGILQHKSVNESFRNIGWEV